jgi:hypothetical protein
MVMRLYKFVAVILGLIITFAVALSFFDGQIGVAIVTAIGGFILLVSIYASGEIIEVFLSIESGTRSLVNIQKRMLQIQQQNFRQSNSGKR